MVGSARVFVVLLLRCITNERRHLFAIIVVGVGLYLMRVLSAEMLTSCPVGREQSGLKRNLKSFSLGNVFSELTETAQVESMKQNEPLQVFISILSHIGCSGEKSGQLQASARGGVAPYRYVWYKADTLLSEAKHLNGIATGVEEIGTDSLSPVLDAGLYFVKAIDAKFDEIDRMFSLFK